MTYINRDHDLIAYPLSTSPNLETWTMTIGSSSGCSAGEVSAPTKEPSRTRCR